MATRLVSFTQGGCSFECSWKFLRAALSFQRVSNYTVTICHIKIFSEVLGRKKPTNTLKEDEFCSVFFFFNSHDQPEKYSVQNEPGAAKSSQWACMSTVLTGNTDRRIPFSRFKVLACSYPSLTPTSFSRLPHYNLNIVINLSGWLILIFNKITRN